MGSPNSVPRSHGRHDRRQSSRVMPTLPSTVTGGCAGRCRAAAVETASATANSPTATATTDRPSYSSGTPKAKRGWPVIWSMPTMPIVSPMNRLDSPRTIESPISEVTVTNASTMIEKYSAGWISLAMFDMPGARNVMTTVEIVPATNEPMAAVASAAPARPRRAIG